MPDTILDARGGVSGRKIVILGGTSSSRFEYPICTRRGRIARLRVRGWCRWCEQLSKSNPQEVSIPNLRH
jgi:hypothetical protein